jgi:hypothetical protein
MIFPMNVMAPRTVTFDFKRPFVDNGFGMLRHCVEQKYYELFEKF